MPSSILRRQPGRPAPADRLAPPGPRYKWIALSNTTLGVLMATVNASIMLIARTGPGEPAEISQSETAALTA